MTSVARLATVALLFAAAGPSPVEAQARYRGPHPVDLDGHWHFEDGEHLHDGLAVGEEPFGEVDGLRVFLGDPLAYGYDGEVWVYANAHPLPGGVRGYCGLARAHRHPFAPDGAYRRERDGAYRYAGAMRGGLDMAVPARTAPPQPIIAAPQAASPAPFSFLGCLHALTPGPRGGVIPSPLGGCAPTGRLGRRRGRGRPARAAPARRRTYFDGNYGGFESPDARGVRGGRRRGN